LPRGLVCRRRAKVKISHGGITNELLALAAKASTPNIETVKVFDELPSSNDYLREQPPSGDNPDAVQLCATEWQTAGHGRRGKVWSSQPGNVTFSVRQRLARPSRELLGLSLVTGIAVSTVLQQRLGIAAQLKWPNDVLVGGRKLGGLLIELLAGDGGRDPQSTEVITGIGLNVKHQAEFDTLGIGATSLEQLGRSPELDRNELIAALTVEVCRCFDEFSASGWPAFAQRWRAVDALSGAWVRVSGATELSGRAVGVSDVGALLVDVGPETVAVMAGEVSVRPV